MRQREGEERERQELRWRETEREIGAGEIKGDILLTERHSVGLWEGEVFVTLREFGSARGEGDRMMKRLGLRSEASRSRRAEFPGSSDDRHEGDRIQPGEEGYLL